MAEAVYLLCAMTSITCAYLLWKAHRRSKTQLLYWSSLGFMAFALNNTLLVVDLILLPITIDLSVVRASVMLVGFFLLLFGLIWQKV